MQDQQYRWEYAGQRIRLFLNEGASLAMGYWIRQEKYQKYLEGRGSSMRVRKTWKLEETWRYETYEESMCQAMHLHRAMIYKPHKDR